MRFGNVGDFEIEAYDDTLPPERAGFGRMVIRVQNKIIGDIREMRCGLGDAAERFRELIPKVHSLWVEEFEGHTDEQIFRILDNALYLDCGQSDEKVREDAERYSPFDFLTNAGEQFDGFKSFIIRQPDGHLHILIRDSASSFSSGVCSIGSFLDASTAFVAWVDNL